MAVCANCGVKVNLFTRMCESCSTSAKAELAEAERIRQEDAAEQRRRDLKQKEENAKALEASKAAARLKEIESQIKLTYDEFTTVYSLVSGEIPIGFTSESGTRLGGRVYSKAACEFAKKSVDELFQLLFIRVGDGWQWLTNHQVIQLLDGEPEVLESDISTSVLTGGQVFEGVIVILDPPTIQNWIEAKSVRLRVGLYNCTIPSELIHAMKVVWQKRIEFSAQD